MPMAIFTSERDLSFARSRVGVVGWFMGGCNCSGRATLKPGIPRAWGSVVGKVCVEAARRRGIFEARPTSISVSREDVRRDLPRAGAAHRSAHRKIVG